MKIKKNLASLVSMAALPISLHAAPEITLYTQADSGLMNGNNYDITLSLNADLQNLAPSEEVDEFFWDYLSFKNADTGEIITQGITFNFASRPPAEMDLFLGREAEREIINGNFHDQQILLKLGPSNYDNGINGGETSNARIAIYGITVDSSLGNTPILLDFSSHDSAAYDNLSSRDSISYNIRELSIPFIPSQVPEPSTYALLALGALALGAKRLCNRKK